MLSRKPKSRTGLPGYRSPRELELNFAEKRAYQPVTKTWKNFSWMWPPAVTMQYAQTRRSSKFLISERTFHPIKLARKLRFRGHSSIPSSGQVSPLANKIWVTDLMLQLIWVFCVVYTINFGTWVETGMSIFQLRQLVPANRQISDSTARFDILRTHFTGSMSPENLLFGLKSGIIWV